VAAQSNALGLPLPFLQQGVAQIALVVQDLDQTVENYWRLFGVGPWTFYTYARPLVKTMSYRGQHADYAMRLALAYAGDTRLELIEIQRGETVYGEHVREHGYGVHHWGVLVEDMADAIAQAEAAGIAMIQDGAGFGRDGDGHFAYLDTEALIGVTIELIQRPKGRAVPEKVYPEQP